MVEMIITDIDQTFLNDNSEASDLNIKTVKKIKERGIKFGIATGRSRKSLERVLDKYDIKHLVDYMITLNGVTLYDNINKIEYNENFLKREIIDQIYNEFKSSDVSFALYAGDDHFYCSRVKDEEFILREIYNYKEGVIDRFEELLVSDFPKMMIVGKREDLDSIQKRLEEREREGYNFFRSLDTYLEIVAEGVSKGTMLRKLCNEKKIDISKAAAIGDNMNDLEMIQYAGIGIAVANAHSEIINAADVVTKSNNEDGFSYACEYIFSMEH